MKLFLKVFAIALVLAALFLGGFVLWGERFESVLSQEQCAKWFAESRSEPWYGIIMAVLIPLVLWPAFLRFVLVKERASL